MYREDMPSFCFWGAIIRTTLRAGREHRQSQHHFRPFKQQQTPLMVRDTSAHRKGREPPENRLTRETPARNPRKSVSVHQGNPFSFMFAN